MKSSGLPSITLTRDCDDERDATKAAGACREALRRPSPPRLLGRQALSQDQSDRGPPMMPQGSDKWHCQTQLWFSGYNLEVMFGEQKRNLGEG